MLFSLSRYNLVDDSLLFIYLTLLDGLFCCFFLIDLESIFCLFIFYDLFFRNTCLLSYLSDLVQVPLILLNLLIYHRFLFFFFKHGKKVVRFFRCIVISFLQLLKKFDTLLVFELLTNSQRRLTSFVSFKKHLLVHIVQKIFENIVLSAESCSQMKDVVSIYLFFCYISSYSK